MTDVEDDWLWVGMESSWGEVIGRGWYLRWTRVMMRSVDREVIDWAVRADRWATAKHVGIAVDERLLLEGERVLAGRTVRNAGVELANERWITSGQVWYSDRTWNRLTYFAILMDREMRSEDEG